MIATGMVGHRRLMPQPAGITPGGRSVSIVRVGLAETKKFSDGYDAIFGKKKPAASTAKSQQGKKKKSKKSRKK